ncbi:RiPP maturation radical SAM C-methyltransferase [Streptomyces radicis]|uniref:RiPP maturation radical SAM protein 1 n=1 Tax=Streptomyces radicis TaxID=1750517 RepID=A0A3A9VT54_9ACTN|nr:RiPP maturation radical SAM C-methyltransferase [Streptomyces radicis]RKN04261.1 RiPP maturation radical SAM protein 1 [Streptomyces radicis]RKN14779.1 RiPP maturation radical SAM protein 1 [Streptomyces radicis]
MRKALPLLIDQATAAPAEPAPPARRLRVALVNMPWARVDSPSIQCGLLQSIVRRAGHDCDVHYLNVELAAALGQRTYDGIAERPDERLHQLGEWLFSYAAFGDIRPEADYLAEFPEVVALWADVKDAERGDLTGFRRDVLPRWLDDCLAGVDWGSYDVVGFSSTFHQNTASLALGRGLKARWPDLVLVYGGANFDDVMGAEYIARLPWLDYVVTGEGDNALPALLRQVADRTRHPLPGVHRQGAEQAATGESVRTRHLDELPVPDYTDYFVALQRHGRSAVLGDAAVKLPVEFSRGCWWGEKHHCTFCGLNALGMSFRAKSESRALHELEELLSSYPAVHVEAVDNILDMKYLTTVCAELAERRWDMSMFFEVKANLTREQMSVIQRAGIHRIQPGIESLSSHVLGLMRKGATKLINIRLLKWARYYGISVQWNILTGFPGETDEDYGEQAALVPLLSHLQPPEGMGPIWLERFSPYFTDPTFPIGDIRPRGSYAYIYPESLDHSKIAYFFDYRASGVASDEALLTLGAAVREWQAGWAAGRRPSLVYQRLPGRVTLIDRRTEQPRRAVMRGWRADAYVACGDTARSHKKIHERLSGGGENPSLAEVTAFLEQCCRAGVMVSEDGRYLALALPENPGW